MSISFLDFLLEFTPHLISFLVPAFVACIELLTRYSKGANLRQLLSDKLVWLYMTINGFAGLGAYFLSREWIAPNPQSTGDLITLGLVASAGGLALLRTSVAQISKGNEKSQSVSIGPGFVLDLLLDLLDDRIDQNRAERSIKEISELAEGLSYKKCYSNLVGLLIFYMMERVNEDEIETIRSNIKALDENLDTDHAKLLALATILRGSVGLAPLKAAVDALGDSLKDSQEEEQAKENVVLQNLANKIRQQLKSLDTRDG